MDGEKCVRFRPSRVDGIGGGRTGQTEIDK